MAQFDIKRMADAVARYVAPVSSETLAWLAVVLIHASTVPTLLAVLAGLSDNLPTVDMVLMTWAGLAAFFAQACVQRNMLQIITISVGFMMQASLLVLIFFK
jgi:hypothetical protein